MPESDAAILKRLVLSLVRTLQDQGKTVAIYRARKRSPTDDELEEWEAYLQEGVTHAREVWATLADTSKPEQPH